MRESNSVSSRLISDMDTFLRVTSLLIRFFGIVVMMKMRIYTKLRVRESNPAISAMRRDDRFSNTHV